MIADDGTARGMGNHAEGSGETHRGTGPSL